MKAASLNEIKKELEELERPALIRLCARLARYKKENKELLTYLLFDAHDEHAYVDEVKLALDDLFEDLPTGNVYFVKKGVRKVLRILNKQVRYSGVPETELDARIHFCRKMLSAGIPLSPGTVLYNLYTQQLKKIRAVWLKLPEDLRFDYESDLKSLEEGTG